MSSILTGITTSGSPHLGNYVGAIKPAINLSKKNDSFIFLADYHSLIKQHDPDLTHSSTLKISAAFIACGLNPDKAIFYRQSKIYQIMELNWILSSITPKGLMNRAHAYKAMQDATKGQDKDKNVLMGLFNYPILMSADILMFNADSIPVGSDQKQHIEMTRDIAEKFNNTFGNFFTLPEPLIDKNLPLLPGIDGQKMSKSYNNFIDLFCSSKELQKKINSIKTDSLMPGERKDKNDSLIYLYFQSFCNDEDIKKIDNHYQDGMGWGDLKKMLFDIIDSELGPYRDKYEKLISRPSLIEEALTEGEKKASKIAQDNLERIRELVGIKSLNGK